MHRIAVFAVLAISLAARAEEPGKLWQVETSMEMAGMKMPGQNRQVCVPVAAEGPEAMAGGDSECTMSNVRRAPGKFSFDVACPQGSGSGEMIYQGSDSYTQTMTMTTDGQTMKMVTHGQRLGGACDAGAVQKQVAAAQAQATAGMAQACASMVDGLMPGNLQTYECDPKYKDQLCRKFNTREGFGTVAERPTTGQAALDSGTLPEVARYCGADANALRTRFCSEANKSEDLEFLGTHCPAQAQVIAQRECAGRSFTSPAAPKYQGFCGTFARATMQGGSSGGDASEAAPATTPPGEAIQEGAKRLKGMLGF
jgi:Protein of unknown function (DUF3617)